MRKQKKMNKELQNAMLQTFRLGQLSTLCYMFHNHCNLHDLTDEQLDVIATHIENINEKCNNIVMEFLGQ